jgi:hypothetical protein
MKPALSHRGASNDRAQFATRFIRGRLSGFEKDMRICLTPARSSSSSRITHAYFPALGACYGMLEYLTALHRGNIMGIGWQQVADWARDFLPQPDYDRETIRILFDAFRHPVAHRGIASGVWVDRNYRHGQGRRLTWKVLADAKRPACQVVAESGQLRRDPPWPCSYTHRVHIHLRAFQVDIRDAAKSYADALATNGSLLLNFESCMRQLYPT